MHSLSSAERTGRKSHKKMPKVRGKDGVKEAVWPPELEEALLEGLRTYRPISKSGRPLLRFTKRNCFIAKYIKDHTNQSRTAKQVGSRLQQITESCKDEEIIHLITNRDLHLHSLPENQASGDAPEINDIPYSSFSSNVLSVSPTPINTPALSASSTISDLDPSEGWPPRFRTDKISLLMSLNPLDENGNIPQPLGLGLDAEIADNGTNLILTIDHMRRNDPGRLLSIPTHSLFDRAPELSISSTVLAPGLSYMFSFSVYFDGEFIHSETGELIAVKEKYPSEVCTLKTTLLVNHSWKEIIRSTEIERYTIVLDITDTHLCRRRNLFSVDITLKLPSDVDTTDPSPTAFYPSVFEGQHISHDFPELSVTPSSTLSAFTLQSHADFQNGSGMPSWNVPNCFVPTPNFVPYASFCDDQYMGIPEPIFPPPYPFPQM
ncbi:hypothetical protein M413DRAFT_31030 [Hebeloma cylindrosporum]|uniref:TEA domain-containing protein n=1 Tax=Hebeloma cylindrosporum TaxID=76867 RepID=A0A0C3BKS7_HEBCY|nr:hypothetical protein M413DRAFT_31030 [Hebeloma cylindrosporum h7]